MLAISSVPPLPTVATDAPLLTVWDDESARYFGQRFSIWDGITGEMRRAGDHPALRDPGGTAELVRAVARRGEIEVIVDEDGVALLALPLVAEAHEAHVAVGAFLLDTANQTTVPAALAAVFQAADTAAAWVGTQTRWPSHHLLQLADAVRGKLAAEVRAGRLTHEVDVISKNLALTYEEISLLYTVTRNLRISNSDDELARLALEWLEGCVAAEALAIQLLPTEEASDDFNAKHRARLIVQGELQISNAAFSRLVEQLELPTDGSPLVANSRCGYDEWSVPGLRELILVPLAEGDKQFGWLAAFNRPDGGEFGTVEASLLSSVGSLLGLHSSNRDLYREQSEFVANVVRALVSAIDAKDPYTSGHSDRVARFAVRIALEMRCEPKLVNTMYMAGLLHDVGKIGIDDSVLRKTDRLTEAEFEHIKMHPELGCKILAGLKQLSEVLPAVLHHHESWDGRGYPHGLAGEQIPQMARIMAVADAYDAMTSDRPYRTGMSEEKVDRILREGSGTQWDPQVVAAYFAAKSDILSIARRERSQLTPIEEQWI